MSVMPDSRDEEEAKKRRKDRMGYLGIPPQSEYPPYGEKEYGYHERSRYRP